MRHYIRADRMQVGMTVDFGVLRRGPVRKILDITPAAWGEGYLNVRLLRRVGFGLAHGAQRSDSGSLPQITPVLVGRAGREGGLDEAPTIDPLYLPEHWDDSRPGRGARARTRSGAGAGRAGLTCSPVVATCSTT